jgi:tartrate-resistant acid phosphatase type 5
MRRGGGASLVVGVVLGLAGCSEPSELQQEGSGSEASVSGSSASGGSSAAPADSGSGSSGPQGSAGQSSGGGSVTTTEVDSSGAPESTGGEPMGEPGAVRFVAFGDQGEGNEAQQMVANAAEVVCADRGCDFALLLGDNFYDVGVTSEMDQQFTDKFETIYEGLDMRFYVVLGNHDYGTLANDWIRGNYQVEYTQFSDKWYLPHYWYTFSSESGQTQFFAFDTARMMWNHDVGDQRNWLANELLTSTASWKIAFAHHPYISSGHHGNAGNYEGFGWLPFLNGEHVQEAIEDFVCGNAQIYISGHDHDREVFDPVCGTYFFISGASSKVEDFEFREDNPIQWGDDTREGFLWMEIQGIEMVAAFYDLDGNLDHELSASL